MNLNYRNWIIALFLIFAFHGNQYAQDNGLGLGLMFGEPTGFSAKYWLDDEHAVDMGLAYSFVHPHSAISIHADYLIHVPNLITKNGDLPFYYGFGGRIHVSAHDVPFIGARGVVGLVWMSKRYPLDVFFEIAPVFNIFAETSLHLDMAVGARYYLK